MDWYVYNSFKKATLKFEGIDFHATDEDKTVKTQIESVGSRFLLWIRWFGGIRDIQRFCSLHSH